MNKYELVYIIDPAVEETARKELIERYNALIEQNGGKVDKVDEWGKRTLAYAINYKTEGYYVLVCFSAEAELPHEIERNLQISESILRYQVIRVLEKRSNVKPRAPRPVRPIAQAEAVVADAEEAPVEENQEPVIE